MAATGTHSISRLASSRRADMLGIVEVAAGHEIADQLLALQDQAFVRRIFASAIAWSSSGL